MAVTSWRRNGAVVSMLRLEIAGLITARSAEPRPDTRADGSNGMAGNIPTTNPENPRKSGADAGMALRSLASD